MNKSFLYMGLGLGAAALGYLAYRYMLTPTQMYRTTSINPNSQDGTSFTTDPYQSYPFQSNTPPRMDGSNQPWANNNRGAIAQVSAPQLNVNLSNANMIANFSKAAAETAQGLTSVWETLGVSDWFNSEDPSGFVAVDDFTLWEDPGYNADDYSWGNA